MKISQLFKPSPTLVYPALTVFLMAFANPIETTVAAEGEKPGLKQKLMGKFKKGKASTAANQAAQNRPPTGGGAAGANQGTTPSGSSTRPSTNQSQKQNNLRLPPSSMAQPAPPKPRPLQMRKGGGGAGVNPSSIPAKSTAKAPPRAAHGQLPPSRPHGKLPPRPAHGILSSNQTTGGDAAAAASPPSVQTNPPQFRPQSAATQNARLNGKARATNQYESPSATMGSQYDNPSSSLTNPTAPPPNPNAGDNYGRVVMPPNRRPLPVPKSSNTYQSVDSPMAPSSSQSQSPRQAPPRPGQP